MQFLNPIWLWGFTALIVPVSIHLLSRREGKIIKIGSIRHLEETSSKQFKSIRLNEIFLLLLRCLLITLLILYLSGFRLQGLESSRKWMLIEPSMNRDAQFTAFIDSLKQNGFEAKSLTKEFHDLPDGTSNGKKVNYWNILAELKKHSVSQAIVVACNYAEGFSGRRPSLPDNVQWLSKSVDPDKFVLNAIRMPKDSLVVRMGTSSPEKTSFSTRGQQGMTGQDFFKYGSDSAAVENFKKVSVQIVTDSSSLRDRKIIIAALQAIDEVIPDTFEIKSTESNKFSSASKSDWLIWLSRETRIPAEDNVIYLQQKTSNNLLERTGPFSWALTQRLNEQVALEQNLTTRLALIISPQTKNKNTARQKDRRVLDDELIWAKTPNSSSGLPTPVSNPSSEKYLFAIFLLVLLFERWMAHQKNQ
jgi:hypothetical protein